MKKLIVILTVFIFILIGLLFAGFFDNTNTIELAKEQSIYFTDERPNSSDSDIIVCIPAAYSSKEGIIGHYSTGKGRKGASDYRYTTIHLDGNTHFQQASLVRNNTPKTFSDKRLRYRRALCQKNGRHSIVQSKRPVTLSQFSSQLADYDNAWNLDMGTYSYGWYKDESGLHHLGISTFWNKHKQTNWIIVRKNGGNL